MPINAACLKHARGNGLQYCVLKHARNASIPFEVSLEKHVNKIHPMGQYPQRAKHAINDHFHSYATGQTIDDHCTP